MDVVKSVVEEQESALFVTVESFRGISKAVEIISGNVKSVSTAATNLNQSAKQAENSIHEIADIAEEAAAGTEEVSASTDDQVNIIHAVTKSAESLSVTSGKLKENVEHFTV